MKLNLGVVDIPYTDHPESGTTGDVAEILEEKYKVMEIFFDLYGKEIAQDLENDIAGAIENAFAGGQVKNLFGESMSKCERRFRAYIDKQEHRIKLKKMDAPKAGARKKQQYKKVKHTTPFIDSGLYRRSFKAWTE